MPHIRVGAVQREEGCDIMEAAVACETQSPETTGMTVAMRRWRVTSASSEITGQVVHRDSAKGGGWLKNVSEGSKNKLLEDTGWRL